MSKLIFSVLISIYYNESISYFKKSLDNVLCQTLLSAKVALIGDGILTGGLGCIIKEYSQKYPILKMISLPVNRGLGKALNENLKHYSYNLVAQMDTDGVARPDRFEKQIRFFQEHPELDVVGIWIDEFERATSNIIPTRKLSEAHDDTYQFAKKRNPEDHPVITSRKQAVLAANGYQHFPLFEDYYLWVRMLQNGAKFYDTQGSLLYFRFSPAIFKQRSDLKYVTTGLHFQNQLRNLGFITPSEYLYNVLIRVITRTISNTL